jgi:apolipoprotein D and lipocalin family protein
MLGKIILIIISILAYSSCGFAWGRCPNVKYEQDQFLALNYTGRWFEVIRDVSIPFEKGTCQEANYNLNANGSITVVNSENRNGTVSATRIRADPTSSPFRFLISGSDTFIGRLFKGDYQIVNTDYNNFSIVYSCTDLFVARYEFFWVLSRNPLMRDLEEMNYTSYLNNKFGITEKQIHYSVQENCTRHGN